MLSAEYSYQIFETYYKKAQEAERKERFEEAARLYLLAGEAMLKTAKKATGETKAALVRRSDKLRRMSELMEEGRQAKERKEKEKEAAISRADAPAGEESGRLWQSVRKPAIGFDDIAGLLDVKDSIRRRVILPRLHPEVYKTFRRSVNGGILLYGPPGTGKTMMAMAIAREVDAEFYSIRCSDVVSKYFGEAEKNIRSLFETARSAKGAVIFFDEFEALGAQRGSDSPVMNRLVPELLSQMDGFGAAEGSGLLFLAATNRPWDLDNAFLRPPRLTEKIYVGLPDYQARLYMAEQAFEGVPCQEGMSPEVIASRTEGYNGADIVELCGVVKDLAIGRTIDEGATSQATQEDMNEALRRVHSSVQKEDLEKIKAWERGQGIR